MNFFAHAVVASWTDAAPRFVLGAMLPDLANMCGTRIREVHAPRVRAGVEHHHAADAVFHQLPWFTVRARRWNAVLRSAGVRRGPALAAAHVGVEIAIDSALAASISDHTAYEQALEVEQANLWDWLDPAANAAFDTIRSRLQSGEPKAGPTIIARRVAGALASRPRLAMDEAETSQLSDVLEAELAEIHTGLADLLDSLRVRLQGR